MAKRHGAFLRELTLGALAALAALVLAACVVGAPPASAAPTEPTLTVAQLQALLDASPDGTAQGYFNTVLRGATIVRIPVTVESVVPYSIPEGSLILFRARGAAIEEIGGIASGMSGSPLFITGGGDDKLVGAVSYGDVFTKGYLGLATPVEYMARMEDTFLPAGGTAALTRAVHAAGRTVTGVTVAASRDAAFAVPRTVHTAVMAPLAQMTVAGLPQNSAPYKDVVRRLEAHGIDVAPYGARFAGGTDDFTAPLVGGSSVAVLLARGDVIYGALGTVTWGDGDRVVAFGHPFMDLGTVDAYLSNAYVHGVWSSTMVPYKVVSPGKLRGSLLQDRGSGIAGSIADTPEEVPLTGAVTLQPQGVVGSTASWIPQWMIDGFPGGDGVYLAADVLSAAGYQASDNATCPGGATTNTTVVVEDADGQRYTVTRANTWDDTYDVLGMLSWDTATMLQALTDDPDGVAPAHVVSVDLTGSASPTRSSARIVDVRFPKGVKGGSTSPFEVELNLYGQTTPLVLRGSLDLPVGASPTGTVNVYPASQDPAAQEGVAALARSAANDGRQTVAERVKTLEELPTNDQLVVQYIPDGLASKGAPRTEAAADGSFKATLTAADRYVTGSLQRRLGQLTLRVRPATVRYLGSCTVSGVIAETDGATKVDLFTQAAGAPKPTKLATVSAGSNGVGGAAFSYRLTRLKRTTKVIAVWAGDERATGTSANVTVRVTKAGAVSPR